MALFDMSSISDTVSGAVKGVASKIGSILDPSGARLSAAELLKGGAKALGAPGSYQQLSKAGVRVNVNQIANNGNGQAGSGAGFEWRVNVSAGPNTLYNGPDAGQMTPLRYTSGVVFPYTPSVSITYQANYSPQKLTHSNQPAYYYDSSEVQAINVAGDFTVQNESEAEYLLAVIAFFRASTKMYYGASKNAGNPPPIVFLQGYGAQILDNIPCVVTTFQHVMPNDVDYYEHQASGCRVPAYSQIQVALQPVMSRAKAAEFNHDEFAAGYLLGKRFF